MVCLNNLPVHVLSRKVIAPLDSIMDSLMENDAVREIMITSAGERVFSAGMDIHEADLVGTQEIPVIAAQELFLKIERMPIALFKMGADL